MRRVIAQFVIFSFALLVVCGCSVPKTSLGLPFANSGSNPVVDRATREIHATKVDSWSGTIEKDAFEKVERGVVGELADWKKLWGQLHEGSKVPEVDFQKNLVYMDSCDANDRNHRAVIFSVDKSGMLGVMPLTTCMCCESSDRVKFQFYILSREGISKF